MKKQYEVMVSTLVEWIHGKIAELQEDFTRSLPVVQKEMFRFKHFRTVEKPPKYVRLEYLQSQNFPFMSFRSVLETWADTFI